MSKKLFAFFLSFVFIFTFLPYGALAFDDAHLSPECFEASEIEIQVQTSNIEIKNTSDDKARISFDLIQVNSDTSEERATSHAINIGTVTLECSLLPANGMGSFSWSVNLTNGDLIKKVNMTLVLEKVSLLSPNIAKQVVKYDAGKGTLFSRASDSYAFDLVESEVPDDMEIRFKCTNFTITVVDGGYSVPNTSTTGYVRDRVFKINDNV